MGAPSEPHPASAPQASTLTPNGAQPSPQDRSKSIPDSASTSSKFGLATAIVGAITTVVVVLLQQGYIPKRKAGVTPGWMPRWHTIDLNGAPERYSDPLVVPFYDHLAASEPKAQEPRSGVFVAETDPLIARTPLAFIVESPSAGCPLDGYVFAALSDPHSQTLRTLTLLATLDRTVERRVVVPKFADTPPTLLAIARVPPGCQLRLEMGAPQ